MHLMSGYEWILWYGGLLFAAIVLPARLLARCAGIRLMDTPSPILILKKLISTLFGRR
jgi:hypothetical protein